MGHMGKHDMFFSILYSNSHKKLPGSSCRTEIYLNEENSEPDTGAKEICFIGRLECGFLSVLQH